jgi:schlafen family protein
MWVFTWPPDQLQESDLRGLIRDKVQESVTLDFKRGMYGRTEGKTKEMLRDVASLANANGGILIIGMAEDGDAAAADLIPVPDAEVEAQRLVASCAANVAERISGLRVLRVPIHGGDAIVVWAPPSYRKPHMITFQGATEFWIRHDRQNVRMSIAEIHTAVAATEDLAVRVDEFIRARMQVWEKGSRDLFALMATPLLLQEGRVDTGDVHLSRALERAPEQPRRGGVWLSNPLHGRVVPTLRGRAAGDQASRSLEVYRSGHVEFLLLDLNYLASRETNDIKIHGWMVAEYIARFTQFLNTIRDLTGIADPYTFTLCLRGCEGWMLPQGTPERFGIDLGPNSAWDEGPVLLVGSIVATPDENSGVTAQRIADRFWHAFHFEECPFFDRQGCLLLPDR